VLLPVAVEQTDGVAVGNAYDSALENFRPDGRAGKSKKEWEERSHPGCGSSKVTVLGDASPITMTSKYLTVLSNLWTSVHRLDYLPRRTMSRTCPTA
jgi:hypothetical protein